MTSEHDDTSVDVGPARRRRRVWLVAGVVALLLLVAGAVAAFLFLRESTTAVDIEDAVGDFRREQGSTGSPPTAPPTPLPSTPASTISTTTVPAPGSGVPEPGVYTYATRGHESIDALGGRSHRYPEVSTITVTHEACGAVHTWRPLRERWDATTTCPADRGQELRLYRSHHEFFGIDDTRDFVCDPGSLWFPSTIEPGATWTVQCRFEDIRVRRTGSIIGTERVQVGADAVTVLTFELHDQISGASVGINERTVQIVPDTGLIVTLEMLVDVENDSPIGDVHYVERVRLRLTSLVPRR
jgi:hypothetical protein